ncbi:MAG: ABC transporter permease, partial [Pseudomonadota bacterium]
MAKSQWREAGVGLIVPAVVIALWQAAATLGWVNPQVLPSPWAVVRKWFEYLLPLQPYDAAAGSWLGWAFSGELIGDAMGSLYRVIVGFVVGAGLALPLGLAMGAQPRVYAWLNPLVQLLRPIPPIAYIPLSILWFGLGNPPAVFLIALGAFFP